MLAQDDNLRTFPKDSRVTFGEVTFVSNKGDVFRYELELDQPVYSGLSILECLNAKKGLPSTYDFIRLRVKGNPLIELGGGFKLDNGSDEPSSTISISKPIFFVDDEGHGQCRRD